MKCDHCGKEMEEKILFTSLEYFCQSCQDDGWQSIDDMLDMLSPMDFPVKLKFKDSDGKEGGVFVSDASYFDRCPRDRQFKVQGICDPYVGVQTSSYFDDSDDDGC